jgi:hypothetical protein
MESLMERDGRYGMTVRGKDISCRVPPLRKRYRRSENTKGDESQFALSSFWGPNTAFGFSIFASPDRVFRRCHLRTAVFAAVRATKEPMQNAEDNSQRKDEEKEHSAHELKHRVANKRFFRGRGNHGGKSLYLLGYG